MDDTASDQKIEKGITSPHISKKTVLHYGENTMGKSCKAEWTEYQLIPALGC